MHLDQLLNNWDVSSVKDMNFMFYKAGLFNQPLNGWITSSLTSTAYMFAYASIFNQDLG